MTNNKFKRIRVIAILPAYRASKTLVPFLNNFPREIFDEIILIDDCSPDNTYEIAKKQKGLKVYQTPHNLGYGGNLKMCLSTALDHGADVIIEIHPDGEYGTDGVLPALNKVNSGAYMVLGNRFSSYTDVIRSGWRPWKYPFTTFLTLVDNFILGTKIHDLHQGFRVYTRKLLENINFKATSNNYIFSFEIISQTAFKRFPISEVPVTATYHGNKRGASLKASIIYSLSTFKVLLIFLFGRLGLKSKMY